jgi:phenylpropionate dioxygenase-like ring-hydroxylating dioxygenase large terminal subunit
VHDPETLHGWFAGCLSTRLRGAPLPLNLLNRPVVLFRDAQGVARGLEDRCPHRLARLSDGAVKDGALRCPYHGWRFDGGGACIQVPGLVGDPPSPKRCATPIQVAERDGVVWLGADAEGEPPALPLSADRAYTTFSGEATLHARLFDALENFLDATHTHFVHPGLIRKEGPRKVVRVQVIPSGDGVEAVYRDEGTQSGVIARAFGADVDCSIGRFRLPGTVELDYLAGDTLRMRVGLFFRPGAGETTHVVAVSSGRAPRAAAWLVRPAIKLLFRLALRQDARILSRTAENRRRHPEQDYVFTELDVMAPHLLRLLRQGPARGAVPAPREIEMRL